MTSLIVAKRYARALLEIGKEDGNLDQYGKELAEVSDLFAASPELEQVLASPAIDFEDRSKLLNTFLEKLGLSPIANNFFRLLMDRDRIAATSDISRVYARLLDEEKGITRAEVLTAAALSDAEISRLKDVLTKLAGSDVVVEVKEDSSLIGGVRAQIGDLVLDGTVKTQLETLKDSLRRGDYA
ncbi:MAG: F0F1 ATP synthase subunit delta [Proteobacteria bacterium]|nr:F0F1 ATP synthase subunit delta [Pseudomonadota bacterium]MBU4383442.1 F0F1 ATP synthase subunit delta [Pseudomonadota bacterium]MBU4603435.1 F0F1 ATP synthase subunit delta [Pseudomonadota bacterium]MCG2766417.1 F0F1 ATP synthase subunit delta [Desulfarculaceae bacterium]